MTLHVVQKSQIKLYFRTWAFYQKFWQEGQIHSTLLELLGRLPKAQLAYLEDQLNTTTQQTVLSPEKLLTQSKPDKYTILTLEEFSLSQQTPPLPPVPSTSLDLLEEGGVCVLVIFASLAQLCSVGSAWQLTETFEGEKSYLSEVRWGWIIPGPESNEEGS